MAGINQGVPETAVGEPIHFGDIDGFEIEQHPISDRLIIRDTANGKEAYVRAERGGQIGGDGVLIKALKESKPMADDGRVYETIQEAERKASSWVFVPPGTFNESVTINTEGLTVGGSGYNTLIDSSGIDDTITINANSVTVSNLSVQTIGTSGTYNTIYSDSSKNLTYIDSVVVRDSDNRGVYIESENSTITKCTVESSHNDAILSSGDNAIISNCNVNETTGGQSYFNGIVPVGRNAIVSNCIVQNTDGNGIRTGNSSEGTILVGNRIINCRNGINITGDTNIIANNRVSGSDGSNIFDNGTGTLLDGNLTGASN